MKQEFITVFSGFRYFFRNKEFIYISTHKNVTDKIAKKFLIHVLEYSLNTENNYVTSSQIRELVDNEAYLKREKYFITPVNVEKFWCEDIKEFRFDISEKRCQSFTSNIPSKDIVFFYEH